MNGPDFVFGHMQAWARLPHAQLDLADGSTWRVPPAQTNARAVMDALDLANRRDKLIFVSGNKATTAIESVAIPRKLATMFVSPTPVEGRLMVGFLGPPSPYYLRLDRPWAAAAREVLTKSARQGGSPSRPNVLVSIDPATSEIMDARAL